MTVGQVMDRVEVIDKVIDGVENHIDFSHASFTEELLISLLEDYKTMLMDLRVRKE